MQRATCGTCKFFDDKVQGAPEGGGVCKHNPPVPQLVMVPSARSPANPHGQPQLTAQGFQPPVRAALDWCGQHAPASIAA